MTSRRDFLRTASAAALAAAIGPLPLRAVRTRATYDVKRYGARGDGRADDRAPIQRAIDAALRAGGGTVYFPAGVYLLRSGALHYGSQLRFEGVGERSLLRLGLGFGTGKKQLLVPRGRVEDVRFGALRFDQRGDETGNDAHSPTISVQGVAGATFEDVIFENVVTMALWCDSARGTVTSDIVVRGGGIRNSAGGGYSFFGALHGATIEDTHIASCRDDAIAFQDTRASGARPRNVSARRNVIRDCNRRDWKFESGTTPNGIMVFGARDAIIEANEVDGTLSNGIAVYHGFEHTSEGVTIRNNRVRRAGISPDRAEGVPGAGFSVRGSRRVVLEGNQLDGSRLAGLECTESEDVRARSNRLRGCGGAGLRVDASRGVQLVDNIIEGYGERGVEPYGLLAIGPSTAVVVTGTQVRLGRGGNEANALHVVGRVTGARIEGNDFRGHRRGALSESARAAAGVRYRNNTP